MQLSVTRERKVENVAGRTVGRVVGSIIGRVAGRVESGDGRW